MTHLSKFSNHSKDPIDLVFNWHLLEACNYRCEYCFAKWDIKTLGVCRDRKNIVQLLEQLASLIPEITNGKVRLNIAGGEPMLLLKGNTLEFIIKEARRLNMKVSIITNGSRVTDDFIFECAGDLENVGISVDSLNHDTNKQIGRIDRSSKKTLSHRDFEELIFKFRWNNPDILVKINVVVNSENYEEDMSEFFECVKPDRVKILRMLPVITTASKVSDDQFKRFCDTHQYWIDQSIAVVEDNEDMVNGYLMIDPFGRFFENGLEEKSGYKYNGSILDVGVKEAMANTKFDYDKYRQRY